MISIGNILDKREHSREDIVNLLNSEGDNMEALFNYAANVQTKTNGSSVHLRGLLEISNICHKNCFYCGIRNSNYKVLRYELTFSEIFKSLELAQNEGLTSLVIQSGERTDNNFVNYIISLVHQIHTNFPDIFRITLSCGEQSPEAYYAWRKAGADRYLLRIESSNANLYRNIHPDNPKHSFENRLSALKTLKKLGYQVGTGVLIGFPGQITESLADDILFMKSLDTDMCGMGPYILHNETPLSLRKNLLLPTWTRYEMALKMIAVLRIVMPDINIAAATSLESLRSVAKINALRVGANVLMPNITPVKEKSAFSLYENKPGIDNLPQSEIRKAIEQIKHACLKPAMKQYGDSLHFTKKIVEYV